MLRSRIFFQSVAPLINFAKFEQSQSPFVLYQNVSRVDGIDIPEIRNSFSLLKHRPSTYAWSSAFTGTYPLELLLNYRFLTHSDSFFGVRFLDEVDHRVAYTCAVDHHFPSIHGFFGTRSLIEFWQLLDSIEKLEEYAKTIQYYGHDSAILFTLFSIGLAPPDVTIGLLKQLGVATPTFEELTEKAGVPLAEITQGQLSCLIGEYVLNEILMPQARFVGLHSLSALSSLRESNSLVASSPTFGSRLIPSAERAVASLIHGHSFTLACREAYIAGSHIQSSLDMTEEFSTFVKDHPNFRKFLHHFSLKVMAVNMPYLLAFPSAATGYARAQSSASVSEKAFEAIKFEMIRRTLEVFPEPKDGDSLTTEELSQLNRNVSYADMPFGPPGVKRVTGDHLDVALELWLKGHQDDRKRSAGLLPVLEQDKEATLANFDSWGLSEDMADTSFAEVRNNLSAVRDDIEASYKEQLNIIDKDKNTNETI